MLDGSVIGDDQPNEGKSLIDRLAPDIECVRCVQEAGGTKGNLQAGEDGVSRTVLGLACIQRLKKAVFLGHLARVVYMRLAEQGR
jgi:hypothetical protein